MSTAAGKIKSKKPMAVVKQGLEPLEFKEAFGDWLAVRFTTSRWGVQRCMRAMFVVEWDWFIGACAALRVPLLYCELEESIFCGFGLE